MDFPHLSDKGIPLRIKIKEVNKILCEARDKSIAIRADILNLLTYYTFDITNLTD